ncbi:MAG: zf-TFIIB domain-containing protein [Gemmatimonadales bacterium]
MSTEKPSQNEDEYFALRDAELVKQQRAAQDKAAADAERKSHYLRCPKCGGHLTTQNLKGVQIDQCPDCLGIWFDAGELDVVVSHRDPGLMGRVFGDLFTSLKKK